MPDDCEREDPMSLIDLLIWVGVLAIVVIAGWYVLSQVPLPPPIRQIIIVVLVIIVAIIAIITLLNLGHMTSLRIGG
jgi:phosphoglycerol transferase MdoB-like AlkP superfamily enzyme